MWPKVKLRLLFLKEVFWRIGVAIVLAIYTVLQLIYNAIGWTLEPETQSKYQFIKIVQFVSWPVWLEGVLILLIVIFIEGAYRAVKKRDAQIDDSISRITELENPKLEILFENGPPYIETTVLGMKEDFKYFRFNIGLHNDGKRTINRIRVEIEELKLKALTLHKIPLPLKHNQESKVVEFSLHGGETQLIHVAGKNSSLAPIFFNNVEDNLYMTRNVDEQTRQPNGFEFYIVAIGQDTPPARKGFRLFATEDGNLGVNVLSDQPQ